MATSGNSSRIVLAASSPSTVWVGGIRMSTSTRSGTSSRTRSISEVGVARLPDHFEARPRQEARQPRAQEDVVVGDDHTQRGLCRRIDVESAVDSAPWAMGPSMDRLLRACTPRLGDAGAGSLFRAMAGG